MIACHGRSVTVRSMIQLVDVYKSFGPKHVLEGFTLDVAEGETMVIIGYSGTGKSVAIKHIVGLLEPDSRRGLGRRPRTCPTLPRRELYELRAHIGYVFQFAALFDSFTIGENVAMGLRKQQELERSRDPASACDEALELVDLPGRRTTAFPPSCPAACASASASRARSRSARSTSSTTSRRPDSIR